MISATTPTELAMVLPGSAIKGVLRTQAERIVRTVLGFELPDTAKLSERQRHLVQLNVPLVNAMFGSAKRAADKDDGKEEQSDTEETSTLGRGTLAVTTCYAKNGKATPEEWQQIATAALPEKKNSRGECSPLYKTLNTAKLRHNPFFAQAFHVAVDRWTGGAAEHFLYTALEPFEVAWEPLVLTLDLDPERLPQVGPALVLLLLVLRDLVEGRIGLGFGVNRGYGSLVVEQLDFLLEGSSTAAAQALAVTQTITAAELSAKLAPVFALLQREWRDWIDCNQVEATCANG